MSAVLDHPGPPLRAGPVVLRWLHSDPLRVAFSVGRPLLRMGGIEGARLTYLVSLSELN